MEARQKARSIPAGRDAAVNVADFIHGCSSFSCFLVAATAATLPRGERGVARRRNKMRDVE
jgi:hypothetical protein